MTKKAEEFQNDSAEPAVLNFVYGVTPEEDAYYKSLVTIKKSEEQSLNKSILNVLNGPGREIERLAFESDPTQYNGYAGIYKQKMRLLPDSVLKRIAIQDSLVANIVRARQNHITAFGRPQPDRHSTGYIIAPKAGVVDGMSEEKRTQLGERIHRAIKLFSTCGHTEGVSAHHQKTFSEYLSLVTGDTQVIGRLATEIVYVDDLNGDKKFYYFAHTDAGTIYPASAGDGAAKQSIREEAFDLLKLITGKKDLQRERAQDWNCDNKYAWVQVIEGRPEQVFTNDEMKCRNFYPVGNVEVDGFPVTPIDTVIGAITTHLNIGTHNKVYFQSGRASRGMLVIKSEDVNPTLIHNIKQNFNASINGSSAAWRMPVLGFGSEADVQWIPIDSTGQRDMEFQYLTDMNAREILTAFMISPDELPGWAYLSRGTNSQALSEGTNEFRLEASRDVGIRPLLATLEDFINRELFPLIDPELAKICDFKLVGLDADSPEKEIVNIQQNMQVWMTMNDVLEKVERQPLPKAMGGIFPLNPSYGKVLDAYLTVGQILEYFFGQKDASKDPALAYRRDPMFLNWQQMQMQQQQMQQQAQMAQQQAQQDAPQRGQDEASGGDQQDATQQDGDQQATTPQQSDGQASVPQDLARSIDQAYEIMTKSEANLSPQQRLILQTQQKTANWLMHGFQDDTKDAIKAIVDQVKTLAPKK
jgi:hypothetical protein